MSLKEKLSAFFNKQNTDEVTASPDEKEDVSFSLNPTIEQLRELFGSGITGGSVINSATYYSCMQIRCNALAKLPIHILKSTDDGGTEKVKTHPLTELLKLRPNPYMTAHDLVWMTEYQKLHYGNSFWVYTFKGGRITGIYPLDSTRVNIYIDNAGILGRNENEVFYAYNDNKHGELIYSSRNICHFKNFATDGIKGTSVSKFIYDTITSETMSQGVVNKKYENGLQDPIVVIYTGDLNSEKKAKIQKKFQQIGGVSNAGKVIPIPSDFDIKQLETKLVNSQFFQLQGLTTRRIANAFGVKSFQLNDMEKSTYNNIEQQNRAFYSDTLQNVITQYEQVINYVLFSEAERRSGLFAQINVDAMLRVNLKERYEAYQIGIGTGFLKISEARSKENLQYVEGTDRLILNNGAAIPLSDLGKQYKN